MKLGVSIHEELVIFNVQEDPETLKVKLEKFLKEQNISYQYSNVTKFHNFKKKTLD